MPFAPASNPDLAAQLMFSGISSAGAGLAAGLQKALENQKNMAKDRKNYLALAESLQRQGLMDEGTVAALANQDTASIIGAIRGTEMAAGIKHLQAQSARLNAERDQAAQQMAEDQALGEGLNRYASGPPAFTLDRTSPHPDLAGSNPTGLSEQLRRLLPSEQDRIGYALSTPKLGGRGAVQLLKVLEDRQRLTRPTDWEDVKPREFEVGGRRGAYGKSGQFQFLPEEALKEAVDPNTGQLMDGYILNGRFVKGRASQDNKLDAQTEAIYHEQLNKYNEQLRSFEINEARVKSKEKNPATGQPYTLMDQAPRKTLQRLRDQVQTRLLQGETPAAPAAARETDLEPPVGTIKEGREGKRYRYKGGPYGVNDKRSWELVK